MSESLCKKCSKNIPALADFSPANYCPSCGTSLKNSTQILFGIIPLVVIAFAGTAFFYKDKFLGNKPTKSITAEANSKDQELDDLYKDSFLRELKTASINNPSDKSVWDRLAKSLVEVLKTKDNPSSTLIFETIEALRGLLNTDAQNTFALLTLADISFDMQAFSKASEFYEKYLKIETTDINTRARYGSALSFLGQSDKAFAELEKVLKVDPKNFQAQAYLAVAYAQAGNKDKAKEVAVQAIPNAPSQEAREKFEAFIVSLDKKAPENTEKDPVKRVETFLSKHEIAGSKFVTAGLSRDSSEMIIKFKDFPMDKMPVAVKEKFVSQIISQLKESKIKTLRIIDSGGYSEEFKVEAK